MIFTLTELPLNLCVYHHIFTGSLPVLGMATREVEMSNNGGYSFVLMATDRTMAVSAQSAQERQEWMLLLAKAQMYTQDELPQPYELPIPKI